MMRYIRNNRQDSRMMEIQMRVAQENELRQFHQFHFLLYASDRPNVSDDTYRTAVSYTHLDVYKRQVYISSL